MRPRIFRLRLAFKPTRARIAALLAVLALPAIAQEVLRVTTSFPVPFAQYRRLLTTGVNPISGGPAHTLLAHIAGGVGIGLRPLPLFAPNAGNPSAGGENPRAPLVVVGQTVLGENRVPPAAFDTLWLAGPAGPASGFSMTQRAGAERWTLYPDANGFKFWHSATAGNPLGLGNGVVFGMDNNGQIPYCILVPFVAGAGVTTSCTTPPNGSPNYPYVWGIVDPATADRIPMWDETDDATCPVPQPGPICRCNLGNKCCGPGTPYTCGNPTDNTPALNYDLVSPATCTGAATKSRRNPPGCRGSMVCCRMSPT